MVNESSVTRCEAEAAARKLVDGLPEVEAILLFGSVARGNPGPESDIDLMVISNKPLKGALMRDKLEGCHRISLITHTWETLRKAQAQDWSFFVHLREEGKLLHGDNRLHDEMAKVRRPPAEAWRLPLYKELEDLSKFEDLSIFRGHFGFALSHIFTSARYTCMLDNTAAGEIAFDRDAAFDIFIQRHSDLAEEVACVRRIWPFHARTQGREVALPFDLDDAEPVEEAFRCTYRLVSSTIDD